MPLTELQADIGRLLAVNRSEESYLAGGAAILAQPNTQRFSQDLYYFHDSPARVATAFEADRALLLAHGFAVEVEISQPGYLLAIVRRGDRATKVEWAFDSSWRFMPVQKSEHFGYVLHPIDLATSKVLALAGRDEPRDLLDTVYFHENVLTLGPLVWAAVGKDPGFSPLSLLEMLRRRGKLRPEDLARLNLSAPVDLQQLKSTWVAALDGAEAFVNARPAGEAGCLYYAPQVERFVDPGATGVGKVVPHFGRPGGVLPRMVGE